MSRRMLIMALGIIMAIVGYWYTYHSAHPDQSSSSVTTGIKVGQTIMPIVLNRLDGTQTTVGQSGKITVINFWATWCPPCREEMPDLDTFAHKNQQKVDFYAINLEEPIGKISEFMDKNKYTMPVLLDTDGAVAKKFQVTAIPTTIIVNKHGMIKYRKSGGMTVDELEGIINSL